MANLFDYLAWRGDLDFSITKHQNQNAAFWEDFS